MPVIIDDIEQGTSSWFALRLGIPSGSNFDKIVTMKGVPTKQREKYLYQLAGELLLGEKEETHATPAMLRGTLLEGEARKYYEFDENIDVIQVGFIFVDDTRRFGISPDGLVGKNGLVEIKCPSLAVHLKYLDKGILPSAYFQQVQGQILVSGREWVDFFSYFPHENIPNFKLRVYRDDDFIGKLWSELDIFVEELGNLVEKLKLLQ